MLISPLDKLANRNTSVPSNLSRLIVQSLDKNRLNLFVDLDVELAECTNAIRSSLLLAQVTVV